MKRSEVMSTADFPIFARAVRRRFDEMQERGGLLRAATDRDAIWAVYLGAFPPGADPIFRSRTEHDCSCCRHFVRTVGRAAAVENGTLKTVWDLSGLPEPYQAVADAVAAYVRGCGVFEPFLVPERRYGAELTRQRLAGGEVLEFSHFHAEVRRELVTPRWAEKCGEARETHRMILRAFDEVRLGAVDEVIELARGGRLYRGAENLEGLEKFRAMLARLGAPRWYAEAELLAWTYVRVPHARLRNTAVGTLVQDLSEGAELEWAVRAYEEKVAPQNYRRPKPLITKKMADDAARTISDLNVEGALRRRHARLEDVSVESVFFVDHSVRGRLRGGTAAEILEEAAAASAKFDPERAPGIAAEEFADRVLPRARSIELYLANEHSRNLVTLTAPEDRDTGRLFRWGNDFAWAYEGDAADSIREKVKRAGGRVEGVSLRVSLAWYNYDDLDLHAHAPALGHVYFSRRCGVLDVDMNAGCGRTREPVENMRWVGRHLQDGTYHFRVHQFCKREEDAPGFEVEIEYEGRAEVLRYALPMRYDQVVRVAELDVRDGRVAAVRPSPEVVAGAAPRECWGLTTQRVHPVQAVVLSPNCWGGRDVGHRHWIFALRGCRAPGPVRGFYNEFLEPRLAAHRRAFEVLGDRTRCPPSDDQVSGLGFTAGRGDSVVVVVRTRARRREAYLIAF